jgi:hypothetical protein
LYFGNLKEVSLKKSLGFAIATVAALALSGAAQANTITIIDGNDGVLTTVSVIGSGTIVGYVSASGAATINGDLSTIGCATVNCVLSDAPFFVDTLYAHGLIGLNPSDANAAMQLTTVTEAGPFVLGNVSKDESAAGGWDVGGLYFLAKAGAGPSGGFTAFFQITSGGPIEINFVDTQGAGLSHTAWVGTFSQVPGPIAGAGLPGLIAACGGLLALARRRKARAALA